MSTVPSIVKQFTVEAPAERAFRVFTSSMGTWWPKEHHINKSPLVDCVIEPKVGGRWYERCEDGSTCDWGKVLVWEPPTRLVLAWQLNAKFEFDPELITEVDVRFKALDARRTQVDFEHRNLDRFAEMAQRLHGEMGAGWGQILESFGRTAAGK